METQRTEARAAKGGAAGLKKSDKDKSLPLCELRQQVIDKIMSYDELDETYRKFVAYHIFKKLKFRREDYYNMLNDPNFLSDDSRIYSYKKYEKQTGTTRSYPRANDEVAKGFPVDQTQPFHIKAVPLCVPGNAEGELNDKLTFSAEVSDNPHAPASALKWYESELVNYYDLNANSLTGKKWLNHTGHGPNVITSAFDFHALQSKIEVIEETRIPVLAVLEHCAEGFHFGTMRSWFTDVYGNTIGVSHGSDHMWYSRNDHLGVAGQWGSYKYTTLMIFGNQRLLWLRPGVSGVEEKYTPRKEKTWCQPTPLPGEKPFYTVPDPPSPSYDLGLYDLVEEKKPEPAFLRPDTSLNSLLEPDPLPTRIANLALRAGRELYCATGLFCATALLGYKHVKVRDEPGFCTFMNRNLWKTFGAAATYMALRAAYKRAYDPIIKLAITPLEFTGRYEKELRSFYLNHPIDPDTGLPYGYYYMTKDGRQLIQVHQLGDRRNYTNVHKLIQRFCDYQHIPYANAAGVYVESVPNAGPNVVQPNDATFHVPLESPIRRITSAARYKVSVRGNDVEGLHLLTPDKFRQFIASKITKEVVAASASNRVVCGGPKCRYTSDQIRFMLNQFWDAHTRERKPVLDWKPHFDGWQGAKLKRYLAAYALYGLRTPYAAYQTFMKIEALPMKSFLTKAVRLISPNTPLFTVIYRNFFRWFEHVLLQFTDEHDMPLFAKTMNVETRWRTIKQYFDIYRYCVAIDFKNFDATHREEKCIAEYEFYGDLGLEERGVDTLKHARTFGAIQHNMIMRHSGDLFTGSGNCLAVANALWSCKGADFGFLCDGDDTLIFTNSLNVMQTISAHLKTFGYVITCDEAADRDDPNWHVEFCHMVYHNRGYHNDAVRLLNRFANIVGGNDHALASTILGKLQALVLLEASGVDFGFSVKAYMRESALNDRDRIVYNQYKGMEHFDVDHSEYIDLLGPQGGLAGRILADIISEHIFLNMLNDTLWRRVVLRIIKRRICQERNTQLFDPVSIKAMKQAEVAIRNFGLGAMTPYIDAAYRDFFERYYDVSSKRSIAIRLPPFHKVDNDRFAIAYQYNKTLAHKR